MQQRVALLRDIGPPAGALRQALGQPRNRFWCFPGGSPVKIRPGKPISGPETKFAGPDFGFAGPDFGRIATGTRRDRSSGGPSAGMETDFGVFPTAVQLKSGPAHRSPARENRKPRKCLVSRSSGPGRRVPQCTTSKTRKKERERRRNNYPKKILRFVLMFCDVAMWASAVDVCSLAFSIDSDIVARVQFDIGCYRSDSSAQLQLAPPQIWPAKRSPKF